LAETGIDALPGYRRRLRVTPAPGVVQSELEDDIHCMAVTLRHEGGVVTAVEAEQPRAPWTTCPGAIAQVKATFTGVPLAAFASRGEKTANCTHLFDLAQLAAAHAGDARPTIFDILVSDPVEGRRTLELRRDGAPVLTWEEADGRFTAPAALAGQSLMDMRAYQAGLDPGLQEAARLLRWGGMVAHGRTIPLENQSDATRMPPNCFTFQPERARQARRVGEIRDFSTSSSQPLDRRPAPVLEDGGRIG
jgi:hypothetical protein